MHIRYLVLVLFMLGVTGCSSVYYGTMEKMGRSQAGHHGGPRQSGRDTQNETKEQFLTAMNSSKSVVNFKGGDLEKEYNKLNATLKKSESKAAEVHKPHQAVADVSEALFSEWRSGIKQYSSDALRRSTNRNMTSQNRKYEDLMKAMKKAESKLEPALAPLRDQVLFMKHNLNARPSPSERRTDECSGANVDRLVTRHGDSHYPRQTGYNALQSECVRCPTGISANRQDHSGQSKRGVSSDPPSLFCARAKKQDPDLQI